MQTTFTQIREKRKADPYWASRLRTITPTPAQGSTPAPRSPWWRGRTWIWSLLVLLLVLVSAGTWWAIAAPTADSRPIIVRGHIQTNGDEVWVVVTKVFVHNESEEPIANVTTKGDFVLRGEMSPADARKLVLYVEPADSYNFVSCRYQRYLPPLRLAGDRWVEDSTGEPLVATIDLALRPEDALSC